MLGFNIGYLQDLEYLRAICSNGRNTHKIARIPFYKKKPKQKYKKKK